MQLRLVRDPEATKYRFRATLASALVHALVLVVFLVGRTERGQDSWLNALTISADSLVDIQMVFIPPGQVRPPVGEPEAEPDQQPTQADETTGGAVRGGAATPRALPQIVEVPVPVQAPAVIPPVIARADSAVVGSAGEGEGETDRPAFVMPSSPGVRFGDGSLWREPFFVEGFTELLDEIVEDIDLQARMQAIFDSVQNEPGAIERLPEWALSLPGIGNVGLSQKWIELGPIKIPAAVLALLPLPQGNFDEARRRRELGEQRRDLLLAAQRAATVETFKEEVKKIRERMQRERNLRQGGRRDSTAAINP